MIRIVWTLLLAGYLPGALLFRMPVADRRRREALDAGERAFWAIVLSSVWSLSVAFVLALLGRYSFQSLLIADAALVAVIALVWRGRLRFVEAARPGPSLLVPAALVAVCAWIYPPPSEYVMGGKDPGVYVNTGIQIAQRGTLEPADRTVSTLPPDLRPIFFPTREGQSFYSMRFMGYYLLDPDSGVVIDRFPHLYPVEIAIGYGVNGLTGARYGSLVAAAFGVLALYFLGARLAGRTAGAIAAGLLAIHVAQVWYSRYPNSEMLTQALGIAGLLALARGSVDEDPFFLPVAGLTLGVLPFARIEGVIIAALAAGGLLLRWMTGERLRASFLVPLVACGAASAVYLLHLLAPYADYPLAWAGYHRSGLLAAACAAVVTWPAAAWLRRQPSVRAAVAEWTPRALSVLVVALAAYAWFLRQPGGALAPHDAYSFRTYGWYVEPAALAAAILGLVLLLTRSFWRDPSFFVVFIGLSWFVFYRIRIVPEHFWAARRFVPIILPGTMLALGALLAPSFGAAAARARLAAVARQGIRVALLALVAWQFWVATVPIRHYVEYAGMIPRLERLAARFGPDDLVVVESRGVSDLHVLALPLAYIYARQVLVLSTQKPDSLRFAAFVRWARGMYRNVYFLGGSGTDLLSREVGVQPVAGERFQVPEYESAWQAYPTHVRLKEFEFGIYRFVDPVPHPDGISLDIGGMDDLSVVRFYAKEHDPRGTFRWTRDVSYLSLLGISPTSRSLVLWMEDGGRPDTAPAAEVEVSIGSTSLGRVRVGRGAEAYRFVIPESLAAEAADTIGTTSVRLDSTTWNPRALLGADDNRDLGVRVDRVEVHALPAAR